MKRFVYCFLVYYVSIYASCYKRTDCKDTTYSFEESYRAYPALDSIHINDTIWLESLVPTKLNDLIQNQIVDYSGAENLGIAINYVKLIGGDMLNPGGIPAADCFENTLVRGIQMGSLNAQQTRVFRFVEENGSYKFKLGVVPKKRGLFSIAPGDATGVYRRTNKCAKASFRLTFKDTDQHLYLYQSSRPGYQISEGERLHTYCFKVY